MWSRNGSGITSSTSFTDAKRRHKGDPCEIGCVKGMFEVDSTGEKHFELQWFWRPEHIVVVREKDGARATPDQAPKYFGGACVRLLLPCTLPTVCFLACLLCPSVPMSLYLGLTLYTFHSSPRVYVCARSRSLTLARSPSTCR